MKQKLVTRPKLASILMESGYSATITTNPYKPSLKAWVFDLDDKGEVIVNDFYSRLKGGDAK